MSSAYIGLVFRIGISAWPHLWPSTASDCVETVRTRASESILFGLKSTEKSTKVVKKLSSYASGRRSRKFAFTARRLGSLLTRRRARESSPSGEYLVTVWNLLVRASKMRSIWMLCADLYDEIQSNHTRKAEFRILSPRPKNNRNQAFLTCFRLFFYLFCTKTALFLDHIKRQFFWPHRR